MLWGLMAFWLHQLKFTYHYDCCLATLYKHVARVYVMERESIYSTIPTILQLSEPRLSVPSIIQTLAPGKIQGQSTK